MRVLFLCVCLFPAIFFSDVKPACASEREFCEKALKSILHNGGLYARGLPRGLLLTVGDVFSMLDPRRYRFSGYGNIRPNSILRSPAIARDARLWRNHIGTLTHTSLVIYGSQTGIDSLAFYGVNGFALFTLLASTKFREDRIRRLVYPLDWESPYESFEEDQP